MRLRNRLQECYINACCNELLAYKPGNVSIHSEGHDMTVQQFRDSARVSGPQLTDSALALGERVFRAIDATWASAGCNTNLGIVLLSAPLLYAVQNCDGAMTLRSGLAHVLENTTQNDAEWVYRAICVAKPAGLGVADEQDVSEKPAVNLTEAMAIAAKRDRVAYQYAYGYSDIFDFALPAFRESMQRWNDLPWSVVHVFLKLLAEIPDSHIARKYGAETAGEVMKLALPVSRMMDQCSKPAEMLEQISRLDEKFKSTGLNPGTTADITVATLLAADLEEWFAPDTRRSTA